MINDKPLVSVIMSAYNEETYIVEAVNSILQQDYENLELIIIDDASTDRTSDLIIGIKDPRVQLVSNEKNMRLAYNLNKAISISRGEYLARMDADDISERTRISKQVKYMQAHPEIGVLGSFAQCFGDSSAELAYPLSHEEIKIRLLFENAMCHPSIMFRRTMLSETYDASIKAGQDYELWSRLIWKCQFHNMPERLLRYRVSNKQTKHTMGQSQKLGAIHARNNMLKTVMGEDLNRLSNHLIMINNGCGKTIDELVEIEEGVKALENMNSMYRKLDCEQLNKEINRQLAKEFYFSIKAGTTSYSDINKAHLYYRLRVLPLKQQLLAVGYSMVWCLRNALPRRRNQSK